MRLSALLAVLLLLPPSVQGPSPDPHKKAGGECDTYGFAYPEDAKIPVDQQSRHVGGPPGPRRMVSCWKGPMPI